jgi:hypothetical protein
MEVSEIDFLKTMLDGMASAQEQTTNPEAHYIIKPFIRAVSKRIEMTKQPTHGGSRPGAGRKPLLDGKKIPVTKKLSVDIVAYLQSCENATEAIEDAIRRSKGFKAWKVKETL